MAEATVKPTFITLGPLRVRRRHFVGVKEENQKLKVLLGPEGCIYTEHITTQIDEFWEDYHDYQSQGLL
jgi:hypothetical protein